MIYQHPLAYLLGIEGQSLLRAWAGEYDEQFVQARLAEVERLIHDDGLRSHPGVHVARDETDTAYRQWAPAYDNPGNGLLELDLPFIDAVLDTVPLGDAVDVACGTGRITQRLAQRGYAVVGFDQSAEMLDRARRFVPGAQFITADMYSLPVHDGQFDVLTNSLALTHVADLDAAYREFARVLRPGGTAIVCDVHPDLVFLGSTVKGIGPAGQPALATTHHRGVGQYLHAALQAGFHVVRFAELPPRQQPHATSEPSEYPEHSADLGTWREWPWTLLDWAPRAAQAAWNISSITAWQLQRMN